MSTRPQRPDEAAFKEQLAVKEKEFKAVNEKLTKVREQIASGDTGKGGSPKSQALRKQLEEIRQKQANIKGSKAKVFEQVRALEDSIRRKIAEQQASRKKSTYRSASEIDARIASLEAEVDSGKLKLVEEKKYLQEVSQLKRARKQFADSNSSQLSIDEEKRKADELRKQIDDPESKALSKEYDSVRAQLDALKENDDQVFKFKKEQYAERDALSAKSKELFTSIRELKDTYYTNKKAAYAYEQEQKQKRYDNIRAEREQHEKQKRLDAAKEMMDEASTPAYELEMLTCKNLIRYFDPAAAAAIGAGASTSLFNRSFGNKLEARAVEAAPEGQVALLNKKDREAGESYFAGKGKKQRKQPSSAQVSDKFNLSLGTIQDLATVSVQAPLNQSEVAATVEKLKERLVWFQDHQEKETNRRIAKAQKEIDLLEAAVAKEKPGAAEPTGTEEASKAPQCSSYS
ncbi:hypothetical protein BCR37DRAFT_237017 [Protomyces lactucae-debilis]|uniref:Nuclear segregation protein Bfr1 n=1 Tax=Protomyces lactucae-debilis TaxID=2754530 RepID=A0A1Y2FN59_PROLT|nr:uncharacterized protein BCR37DRAFT_237017 [Protomyces lactucae-debilis]ORY85431.1 hypothetical protein BCR37DRAFT_237017 [Protomyces lactucae-debilis]